MFAKVFLHLTHSTDTGVAKFYVYKPTSWNRDDMRKGVRGVPAEERPELAPHYEETKESFKGRITFCAVCASSKCAINRYECHRYGAMAEFLETLISIRQELREF